MSYEIKINDQIEPIEVLDRQGNMLHVKVGDRKYQLDIIEVEEGVYSIILNGTSYNVEMVSSGTKKYSANTLYNSFDVEIIDAESKYQNSRKSDADEEQLYISTPMPGKVVKILVDNPELVDLMGNNLYNCVNEKYHIDVVTKSRMEFYSSILNDKEEVTKELLNETTKV